MPKKKKIKIVGISLFSGCGGLDMGCHLAKIPVIAAIDNDKDCLETLRLNAIFKHTKIYQADLSTFSSSAIRTLLKQSKPSKFIIIGGPPCQPFSKASYWVGHKRRKGVNDPRNLIGVFFKFIKKLKPDGFLFENVESIMHPKHKEIVPSIISHVESLGYHHVLIRANALDYGVPQRRKRIFIIGSKREFSTTEPIKTHCPPEKCQETGLLPYESVKKFIGKYDMPRYFEKEENTANGTYGQELRQVPPGENYFALTEKSNYAKPKFKAGRRFWSFLLKLHPDQPSWTIAAQPGPWVGPFHWTSRRLRVPEIAAIQTFPENYKFFGNRRSIQKQIGNAVPVLMAKTMIEFLRQNL